MELVPSKLNFKVQELLTAPSKKRSERGQTTRSKAYLRKWEADKRLKHQLEISLTRIFPIRNNGPLVERLWILISK